MKLSNRARRGTPASSSSQRPLPIAPGGASIETPYPGFDVVVDDKWALDWDEKTRRLVRDRVENPPAYRFFTPEQVTLLEAVCDTVLPQGDREPDARVPVAPWIDERLHRGAGDGYRYDDMPDDGETYRLGLAGIDEIALARHHVRFVDLDAGKRRAVIRELADGEPTGKTWDRLPPIRFFSRLVNDVVTNYYAHPSAWAEIGFNGPASPRGHMRLGLGRRDPWEAREERPRSSVKVVRSAAGGPDEGGDVATH